ncbi:hypothetical protein GZ59_34700 [Pectobacterium atrosepticum]|nr:hypothetical protein GZ59_34700 [Pectobacterium atrosepticum]POW24451.1 hypothetical protein PB72LOC_04006 [Pectobacterium atrosepticum]
MGEVCAGGIWCAQASTGELRCVNAAIHCKLLCLCGVHDFRNAKVVGSTPIIAPLTHPSTSEKLNKTILNQRFFLILRPYVSNVVQ